MKSLTVCLLLLVSTLFAQEPSPAPWTPVGVWHAVHAGWTDSICINPDGTYYRKSNGEVGKWYLLCDGKQVSLALVWNRFGAETLAMRSGNEFHAGFSSGGPFSLKREPQPQADKQSSDSTQFLKSDPGSLPQ
jgi:hypothetical protein